MCYTDVVSIIRRRCAVKNTESAEMYLESILLLCEQNQTVRAIDVSRHTGYTKPSVSRAMGLLKASNHITVDESGYIHLTKSGREVAAKILERHRLLTEFLTALGVSAEIADDDACRIEHVISDESFAKIKEFLAKQ
ncbi:MAG: metal-dependent transcriptional regulator [Clostridia bacterium]|nr:metal-dependent transcriptional regulator [Clostridia bacterium]